VCRHHAAILAEGSGAASCFRCPYHGWTYGLNGRLQRAPRLKGIEGFRAAEHGLLPLAVEQWGGLVWVRQQPLLKRQPDLPDDAAPQAAADSEHGVAEWLGPRGAAAALAAGMGDQLVHVASRSYELACNWKVFVDNYLVGGRLPWLDACRQRAPARKHCRRCTLPVPACGCRELVAPSRPPPNCAGAAFPPPQKLCRPPPPLPPRMAGTT
jgi:hypothetical protein